MYKVEFKSKTGVDMGWYPVSYKFTFMNGDVMFITTDKGIEYAKNEMEKQRGGRFLTGIEMQKLY